MAEKHPEALVRIEQPVSVEYDLTNLQVQLAKQNRFPIMVFERPVNPDGTTSPFPIAVNLTASRDLMSEVLGIHPRRVAMEYARRVSQRIEPVIVSREEAPVKEIVREGEAINVFDFPLPIHQNLDPGQYISAGYVTTYDPDTGTDNTAIQRLWAKEPDKLGYFPAPTSHAYANVMKWWERGEDAPVAIWIGHHPSVLIGAMVRLGYPESHWGAAGGLLGQPIRLVGSDLYGEKLLVPADAEIVIEGVVPREVWEAEGPFGEFTGYAGGQRPNPVIKIKKITYRKNAILHDFACGFADMLILGNFPLEARIYDTVKRVIPELVNVHVPLSGHRFHAYLQVKKSRPGLGKDAIYAAVNADARVKHFFVVDEDVDIFDDRQVLWAVATRSQWHRDVVTMEGVTAYPLDPSLAAPGQFGTKGGIDATLPPPLEPGLPAQYPVTNRPPDQVKDRVKISDFVDPEAIKRFPGSY
jgi:2,5-furandicarboxylate decarboxylase 1